MEIERKTMKHELHVYIDVYVMTFYYIFVIGLAHHHHYHSNTQMLFQWLF